MTDIEAALGLIAEGIASVSSWRATTRRRSVSNGTLRARFLPQCAMPDPDPTPPTTGDEPFRILSLDGGGSKGLHIGGIAFVEQLVGGDLTDRFDLIYGTSTGSIIGSMIALGEDVGTIWGRYQSLVPEIMAKRRPNSRSELLVEHAGCIFGERSFSDFRTRVGIVTVNLPNKPMIFKSHEDQLLQPAAGDYVPGFGAKIADAVVASCSARPFFRPHVLDLGGLGERKLVDGGHMANNPTPLALLEARLALGIAEERLRVLSVGTGEFPARRGLLFGTAYYGFGTVRHITSLMETSSKTMEWLSQVLFRTVQPVRVNQAHSNIKTSLLDSSLKRLKEIYSLGAQDAEEAENDNGRLAAVFQ